MLGIVSLFPTCWDLGPGQYRFGDNSALDESSQPTTTQITSRWEGGMGEIKLNEPQEVRTEVDFLEVAKV